MQLEGSSGTMLIWDVLRHVRGDDGGGSRLFYSRCRGSDLYQVSGSFLVSVRSNLVTGHLKPLLTGIWESQVSSRRVIRGLQSLKIRPKTQHLGLPSLPLSFRTNLFLL
jgi:hypothetical protein